MHGSKWRRAGMGSSLLALAACVGGSPLPAMAAPHFERVATFPVYRDLPAGVDPASETVAEIVAVTPDGMTAVYTDGPGARLGLIDITDPAAPSRPARSSWRASRPR
jgi:hypothetical protein